ncbi:Hypothetical predicted protein, partial [Podarcis lilfordi]
QSNQVTTLFLLNIAHTTGLALEANATTFRKKKGIGTPATIFASQTMHLLLGLKRMKRLIVNVMT